MTISKAWLEKKIMCGLCNFGCCNHPSFHVVQSEYPYQHKLKLDESLPLDQTYEAKAWDWMVKNLEPSEKVLFWDVGIKEYDLDYIEPIKWHKSEYEKIIDREVRRKSKVTQHDFF